jgi:hypothetical protein
MARESTRQPLRSAYAVPRAYPARKPEKAERVRQGHAVELETPEPWPEPVDGEVLPDRLSATCAYVALPEHASAALALWVLHAYAIAAAFASPFLAITSPTKRCGKTLLLILLGALVPRRLFASNVTPIDRPGHRDPHAAPYRGRSHRAAASGSDRGRLRRAPAPGGPVCR